MSEAHKGLKFAKLPGQLDPYREENPGDVFAEGRRGGFFEALQTMFGGRNPEPGFDRQPTRRVQKSKEFYRKKNAQRQQDLFDSR